MVSAASASRGRAREGFTAHVCEFVAARGNRELPAAVHDTIAAALVDTVGVALAGGREDAYRLLVEATPRSPGKVPLLPGGEPTTAATAALLNATAGHALDYDDVCDPLIAHTSVVLVPALLAVAEERGLSGPQLVDAYATGFKVQWALTAGIDLRRHYERGWHASATLGRFGAGAAVARLLGLDRAQAASALGIAGSMVSGSRQNFGTMTKPLHAGLAARDGVMAALLAEKGYTADPRQLEGELGFIAMLGEGGDPALCSECLASPDWSLLGEQVQWKRYPCCFATHCAADAALRLSVELAPLAGRIEDVRLTLEPGGTAPLIDRRPCTALEAKFNVEYVVACALANGAIGLSTFETAALERPEVRRLAERVSVVERSVPPLGAASWDGGYAVLEIRLAGGDKREARTDVADLDGRPDELETKFRECLAYAGDSADPEVLLDVLRELPRARSIDLRSGLGRSRSASGRQGSP